MVPAVSIQGTYCKNWVRCSDSACKTFINTSILMNHQYLIALDAHRRLGVFGAYGSGKTFATYQMDQKHILITPNGETLIGADTLVQLENTIKKDFEGDFPLEFVKHYARQKNKIDFINGHILYWRTLADEGDLRSYNLSRAHILEASEVKHASYVQIQARVRNENGMKPCLDEEGNPKYTYNKQEQRYVKETKLDWRQIIVESNPDSGWINSEVLMRSHKINLYSSKDNYLPAQDEVNEYTASHIMPTKANYMLPADFYRELIRNKPTWWIKRYAEGSFQYAEGLVYPNATNNIIQGFTIPAHWQRMIGFDYGLNDNSHFIFLAIDWYGEYFKNNKPAMFAYNEIVMNNANIKELADEYKRQLRYTVPNGSLFKTPVMDAKSYGLRVKVNENKTLGTLFREQGCFFRPAQMNLDARIFKLNVLIDLKQLYFFENNVSGLLKEIKEYKYPDKDIISEKASYKPVDKNNHGINALEFAVMEMPPNMKPFIEKPRNPLLDTIPQKRIYNPFAKPKYNREENGFSDAFRGL